MKITKETDYALRIMRTLANHRNISSGAEPRIDAHTIAEDAGISPSFTLKILRKLVSGGVIVSFKGADGGYALAMAPGLISMRRIMEIIDGPFEIAHCLHADYSCPHDDKNCDCKINRVFGELNSMISDKLENITLDMVL